MNAVFKFSLLEYRHAISLGEKLNIGILLLFPLDRKLVFYYPAKLTRAKSAYPDFSEKAIKACLRGIANRVNQLSAQPEIFTTYQLEENPGLLIENEILIPDSSALQFGPVRTAVKFTDNVEHIARQLYSLYLSSYDLEADKYKRHDDEYLARVYRKLLMQKGYDTERLFAERIIEENVQIEVAGETFDFEYGWQNGRYNLVKTLSFDLKQEESIRKKALTYYGQAQFLQEEADKNNYNFDYLVAKPTGAKPGLFSAYEKAKEMLLKAGHVNVIEENEIEEYTEKTLETAH